MQCTPPLSQSRVNACIVMPLMHFFLRASTCGRKLDLDWVNETKLVASTCSSKIPPPKSSLQPTPLTLTPSDLKEHIGLYIQYECTEIIVENNSQNDTVIETVVSVQPRCSVTEALMKKFDHYPPIISSNGGKGQQYNAFVQHIKLKRYGVRGGGFTRIQKTR